MQSLISQTQPTSNASRDTTRVGNIRAIVDAGTNPGVAVGIVAADTRAATLLNIGLEGSIFGGIDDLVELREAFRAESYPLSVDTVGRHQELCTGTGSRRNGDDRGCNHGELSEAHFDDSEVRFSNDTESDDGIEGPDSGEVPAIYVS